MLLLLMWGNPHVFFPSGFLTFLGTVTLYNTFGCPRLHMNPMTRVNEDRHIQTLHGTAMYAYIGVV